MSFGVKENFVCATQSEFEFAGLKNFLDYFYLTFNPKNPLI
jgi:hypothetical protein